MDNASRLQYLDVLGIDVWVPRSKAENDRGLSADNLGKKGVNADSGIILPAPEAPVIERQIDSDDWLALQREVESCQKCALCETLNRTVFGSGNQHADLMLIGEAPGESEDQQGLPFVGKAGLLLTEMIRAMGLARDAVFICNIVKCRPPNNRDPKIEEVQACREYLQRQIAYVQPKLILAVGRIAAQQLLQSDAPLSKLRGKVHQLDAIPVVVVYHPAYLLRSPLEKRKAWSDIQIAIREL